MKRLLLGCLVATGCFHHRAQDVVAHMPVAASPDTGAIDVVLSRASRAVTVTVDGALVADRAHTRRVVVDHVPAGLAHVRVVVDGRCERGGFIDQDVEVVPGVTTAVALPAPQRKHVCLPWLR